MSEQTLAELMRGPAPERTPAEAQAHIAYLEECMRRASLACFLGQDRDPKEVAEHLHGIVKSYQVALDDGEDGDPWQNDKLQFARLLSEISATQDTLDLEVLATEMDLRIEEVNQLFDRAHHAWERGKLRIRQGR